MLPETRSLINKEWRERRLPIIICSGWIFCCLLYVVAYEWSHRFRAPVASFTSAIRFYTLIASIFLAMKTALSEQTQKTFGFTQSLPVSLGQLARIKLMGGIATLILPIILGALIMTPLLWSGFIEQVPTREASDPYIPMPERPSLSAGGAVSLLWTITAVTCAGGLQLFLILSIIGTRLRSESQIGFCGTAFAFVWRILPGMSIQDTSLNGWFGALFPRALISFWGYGVEEGSYSDLEFGQPIWIPLAVNILVLLFLAFLFVRWYGSRSLSYRFGQTSRWQKWPAFWSRIPFPLPNQTAALVWINLRQAVPIAFWGLLLAALLTLRQSSGSSQDFRTELPSITEIVAMLWAVVVGTGIFAAEVQPGLSAFWRSRPLTIGSWFWCKFVTGLIAVLLVLDGATIFVSWGTPISHTTGMSRSYIACMPILHALAYAFAVLGVCWLRRPIQGGIFAIALFTIPRILVESSLGASFGPGDVYNHLIDGEIKGHFDLSKHHFPLVYGIIVAVIFITAWLASRAIRQPENPIFFSFRSNKLTAK